MNLRVNYTNKINKSALLKAAYLIAFSNIGYKLLYNEKGFKYETYGAIIEELQRSNVSDDFPFLFFENLSINMPENIGIIEFGDTRSLFVKVTYTLNTKDYLYYCVLPHPDDESFENILRLRKVIGNCAINIHIRAIKKDYLVR